MTMPGDLRGSVVVGVIRTGAIRAGHEFRSSHKLTRVSGICVASPPAMRFDLRSPDSDFETQPFWDGCKEGPLPAAALQRLRRRLLLPAPVLPEVLERPTWRGRKRAGDGQLYTFSVVRQNDLPPFPDRVPYVAAIVELDEGPRVMTNVEECEFDALEIGMRVRVDFNAISDDVTIPVFRPAASGPPASSDT